MGKSLKIVQNAPWEKSASTWVNFLNFYIFGKFRVWTKGLTEEKSI
jgi:hypothetical protein